MTSKKLSKLQLAVMVVAVIAIGGQVFYVLPTRIESLQKRYDDRDVCRPLVEQVQRERIELDAKSAVQFIRLARATRVEIDPNYLVESKHDSSLPIHMDIDLLLDQCPQIIAKF